jgi:hypothetical protein
MRFLLTIALFAAVFTACAAAAEPSESRYEPSQARKLTPEEAKIFGPQADKYRYDARMIRAAEIAAQRARKHSTNYCWRYVKTALLEAGAVNSYPDTPYAKHAATELPHDYGFKKIAVRNPYAAPLGSVLVYGGRDAGHVEIRTSKGFVSDYFSPTPRAGRPFIGAFVLPRT